MDWGVLPNRYRENPMRLTLLLLLLVNVTFFAWSQYFASSASVDSHLLEQQLNRDAIRLLPPTEVSAVASAQKAAVGTVACLEWGAFNAGDLSGAEEALAPLALGNRLSQRRVDEVAAYWVFLPPQATRPAAVQKTGELKRLGIEDYFIVQDEARTRFTISLGVFRSEEAAKNHLEQLRAKGVRTAQVGPRDTHVQRIFFRVRNVAGPLNAKLDELKQDFPGTDLKACEAVAAASVEKP